MNGTMTLIPPIVTGSPQAFDIYRRFAAHAHATARVLIVGESGAGKSALLGAFRNILRENAIKVSESVRSFDPAKHRALLVDDAHLLRADERDRLAQLAHCEGALVVVATQRRHDDCDLVQLVKLFESVGTAVELTPLDEQGISSAAHTKFGAPIPSDVIHDIFGLTGGLSYLVDAALKVADPRGKTDERSGFDGVFAAVRSTVGRRLQRQTRTALQVMALQAIGADVEGMELATMLDVDPSRACIAVAEAEQCALMRQSDLLESIALDELYKFLGNRQLEALGRQVLDLRLANGGVETDLAIRLVQWRVRDRRLCELLLDAAHDLVTTHPASAVDLYDAALAARENETDLSIRRAEVACRLGRFDDALRLVDGSWEHAVDADLRSAARVSATSWCARGMLSRGAEVYNWVRPDRVSVDGPVAALVLVCAGRPDEAAEMMASIGTGPPTSEVSGNRMLAEAMLASLGQSGSSTLNLFVRSLAAFGTSATDGIRPDSPVAVTAIAALHAGDLRQARKVLQRSLEFECEGSPTQRRHRLLLGWTAMLEGNLGVATTELLATSNTADLPRRDRLLADALRVGIARRRTDTGPLHASLAMARESVDEYSVDLLSLLPVGELWAAASKLGKANEVQHLVDDAFALLERLGDPPFWASALHWFGVTVAIGSDLPTALSTHAHALAAAAVRCEYADVLASAGRVWVRILAGDHDPGEIGQTARRLRSIGLGWDGAHLAARAALRCADSCVAAELLQIARTVWQPVATGETVAGSTPEDVRVLSDRQREVAALLVEGLTYKGVGARLFISPKTVEYHVAEIKRRIGTESRSDLISRLHTFDLSSASP